MKSHIEPTIILGPPGTGKTTTLIKKVNAHLHPAKSSAPSATGLNNVALPERICYVAFTKRAATEAVERTAKELSLTKQDLPYFSTLHSHAFKSLGLRRADVLGRRDYLHLAHQLGLSLTFRGVSDDGTISGLSKGDRLFFMENLARVRQMSMAELWESLPNETIDLNDLEMVHGTLVEYKQRFNKLDYTDMITQYLKYGDTPEMDVLIIDEAQDLSIVQWRMVELIAKKTRKAIYVAGDDDQAIYKWAGADVQYLIDLQGASQTLDQSYRVPPKVSELANEVILTVANRRKKIWKPRSGSEGEVRYINDLSELDMSQGTWLLLARNIYFLDEYVEHCLPNGYLFVSVTTSMNIEPVLAAIKTWEQLRHGYSASVEAVKNVYSYMSVKRGFEYGSKKKLDTLLEEEPLTLQDLRSRYGLLKTAPWYDTLDKIEDNIKDWVLTAAKRGESVLDEPRIRITTIHGSKGAEADNVVLKSDMAYRTYKEYLDNPEDEARVWYVGMTRAKSRLFIVSPRTSQLCPLINGI